MRFVPPIIFIVALLGVVLAWRFGAAGIGGVPAVGEGFRSQVSTPQAGVLQQVFVQPYQMVQAGDPIAVVQPIDPGAKIDLMRTELDMARLRLMPTLAEENAVSYERLRVELLRTKSELAAAQVHLLRAESEVKRSEPLFKEKLLSEDLYELATSTRDLYKTEVLEKSNAVAELQRHLSDLQGFGMPRTISTNDSKFELAAKLDAVYQAAATNWSPITLRAPMSGMVYSINRQKGENVVEGEPLVMINSLWSDRIVGYMRQPYQVDLAPGMKVQITTRERKRRQFWSQIAQVGAHVEVITNALAFVRTGYLVDAGLPVTVQMPPDLKLRPGEVVDLYITGQRNEASAIGAETGNTKIAAK